MPANFSALLDTLLVLAGLVLVVTGLVMFIRSKTSTGASSVEAFGIKLNVTHPSLILVLAGVGLMLAPRLLPEPAGKAEPAGITTARPEAAAPVTPTPSEPPPQPARPSTPVPATTVAPTATPAIKPAAVPPSAAPAAAVTPASRPVAAAKPKPVAPGVPKESPPKIASARPAPTPAVTAEEPVAASPSADAKPARPTLAYAALGLPVNRSFWSGETRASYTRRLHASLQQAGREVLRMDARGLDLGETAFDTWWNESSQHPRSRELCAATQAPLALLSARVETPTTISSVESAYWPELKLRLFVCANQRLYRQQKTLAPQNDDAWPFAAELNGEIERFLRAYRADLAN
jgi:hypothetical protein